MAALTTDEARRIILEKHPDWPSRRVAYEADTLRIKSERLEAEAALDGQVAALQADADRQNAEAEPAGLSGHVGGAASVWDGLRDGREADAWNRLADSATESAQRVEAQRTENARPEGWRY